MSLLKSISAFLVLSTFLNLFYIYVLAFKTITLIFGALLAAYNAYTYTFVTRRGQGKEMVQSKSVHFSVLAGILVFLVTVITLTVINFIEYKKTSSDDMFYGLSVVFF